MQFSIGSRVKSISLDKNYSDIIGVVIPYDERVPDAPTNMQGIVKIKIETSRLFTIGNSIYLYEKELKIISPITESSIDPTSLYQYCIKCDTLTSNKTNNNYICCDHKL